MAVGNLLARYKSGAFEAVWRDIRSLGDIDGDLRAEALEVAEETMRRVARNADVVTERLRALGWRVLMGKLRTAPSADDAKQFGRIESITGGPLPPSLRAFWTIVAGIDWVWDYKCDQPLPELGVDLPMDEMDPLCVDPASVVDYLPALARARLSAQGQHQRRRALRDRIAVLRGRSRVRLRAAQTAVHRLSAAELSLGRLPGLDEHGDQEDVQRFVSRFSQELEPF